MQPMNSYRYFTKFSALCKSLRVCVWSLVDWGGALCLDAGLNAAEEGIDSCIYI